DRRHISYCLRHCWSSLHPRTLCNSLRETNGAGDPCTRLPGERFGRIMGRNNRCRLTLPTIWNRSCLSWTDQNRNTYSHPSERMALQQPNFCLRLNYPNTVLSYVPSDIFLTSQ